MTACGLSLKKRDNRYFSKLRLSFVIQNLIFNIHTNFHLLKQEEIWDEFHTMASGPMVTEDTELLVSVDFSECNCHRDSI